MGEAKVVARCRGRPRATSAVLGGRLPGSSCPGCDVVATSVPAPSAGEPPCARFRRQAPQSRVVCYNPRARAFAFEGLSPEDNLDGCTRKASFGKHPVCCRRPRVVLCGAKFPLADDCGAVTDVRHLARVVQKLHSSRPASCTRCALPRRQPGARDSVVIVP